MTEAIAGVTPAMTDTPSGGTTNAPATPPAQAAPATGTPPAITREQIPAELVESLRGEVLAEHLKGRPETVEGYTLPDLTGVLPEGFQAEILTASPLYQRTAAVAHQYGIPNDVFGELVKLHVEHIRDADVIDRPAETAKLGARAQERLEKVTLWTGANVPKNLQGLAGVLSETAAGVELLEHFMGRSAGPSLSVDPGQGGGGGGGPPDKAAAQAEYDKLIALPLKERGTPANFARRQELSAILHGTAVPEFAAKVLRG